MSRQDKTQAEETLIDETDLDGDKLSEMRSHSADHLGYRGRLQSLGEIRSQSAYPFGRKISDSRGSESVDFLRRQSSDGGYGATELNPIRKIILGPEIFNSFLYKEKSPCIKFDFQCEKNEKADAEPASTDKRYELGIEEAMIAFDIIADHFFKALAADKKKMVFTCVNFIVCVLNNIPGWGYAADAGAQLADVAFVKIASALDSFIVNQAISFNSVRAFYDFIVALTHRIRRAGWLRRSLYAVEVAVLALAAGFATSAIDQQTLDSDIDQSVIDVCRFPGDAASWAFLFRACFVFYEFLGKQLNISQFKRHNLSLATHLLGVIDQAASPRLQFTHGEHIAHAQGDDNLFTAKYRLLFMGGTLGMVFTYTYFTYYKAATENLGGNLASAGYLVFVETSLFLAKANLGLIERGIATHIARKQDKATVMCDAFSTKKRALLFDGSMIVMALFSLLGAAGKVEKYSDLGFTAAFMVAIAAFGVNFMDLYAIAKELWDYVTGNRYGRNYDDFTARSIKKIGNVTEVSLKCYADCEHSKEEPYEVDQEDSNEHTSLLVHSGRATPAPTGRRHEVHVDLVMPKTGPVAVAKKTGLMEDETSMKMITEDLTPKGIRLFNAYSVLAHIPQGQREEFFTMWKNRGARPLPVPLTEVVTHSPVENEVFAL